MIVEFIGSTGAGKTTLIKHILYTCEREGVNAVLGTDFVLGQSRLSWIKSPTIRAVLINLISLFASLGAWRDHFVFYRFVFTMLLDPPGGSPWIERLFLAKNILKRIGIYEIIRRHDAGRQIYLLDEGTLHVAHSLFVQTAGEIRSQDLSIFASIVPLPHVAVYVQQAETILLERLLARGHQRVPDNSIAGAAHFVKQAITVFNELVQHSAIEERLVVVDSAQNIVIIPGDGNNPVLRNVARFIKLGLQSSIDKVSSPERQPVY